MTQLNNHFIVIFLIAQIISLVGCAATPKQVETDAQYTDIEITTKVHEAIVSEPALRSFDINVRTSQGVVELSGVVNSRDDITKTISVIRGVSGIKAIKNNLRTEGTGDY